LNRGPVIENGISQHENLVMNMPGLQVSNRPESQSCTDQLVGRTEPATFDSVLEQRLEPAAHRAEFHNNIGVFYRLQGDLEGALAHLDRALELNPQCSRAANNRGIVRHALGDLKGALADFDRAIGIDPGYCLAYISRGNVRYHKRDPKCEEDYRAAFLLNPQLAAREVVMRLEADIRDDVSFILINSHKRLRIDPLDVVARARLGLTLLLLEQEEEAFQYLQQVFLQSPDWRPFLRLLVNEAKRWRANMSARITQCR